MSAIAPNQAKGSSPAASAEAASGTATAAGTGTGAFATPALRRGLSLRHIVFIGLAYMAPLAVFDTFGIASEASGGHVPLAYVFVLVAVLVTGLSYMKMVRAYPTAGSAYTYAREAINPHVGFMVGWAATLDYLLLPMLNALLSSIYMGAAFPDVPSWVWVLSTIVICTALNLIGVRIAAKVNVALVVIQVIVAASFVFFVIKAIGEGVNGDGYTIAPFFSADLDVPAVASGAAILALSFLGFDAVSTLAEEAENPRRDIPRAILIIVGVAGFFFISVTYLMQALFPDVSVVGDIVAASPEIAMYIGGPLFQSLFLGGYLVAVLGCGITQQMSAARIVFAMGRDGVLPKRLFGQVSPRTGVPVFNVLLVAAIACTAAFLDLSQATSVINFGAFIAFMAVNVSLIAMTIRFVRGRSIGVVLSGFVLPAIGCVINAALFLSLEPAAMIAGGVWALLGFAFLLWRTRFFRADPPALREPALDD